MRFDYRRSTYEVRWDHCREVSNNGGSVTECHVSRLVRGKPVRYIMGEARCHPKDQYCKEYGRKLSLANALQAMGMPKNFRTHVWEAYLGRKGFPALKGPIVKIASSDHSKLIHSTMFFRRIAYDYLVKQKSTIHRLAHSRKISEKDREHLCGLVHLIDSLQDSAVKSGIPEKHVFDLYSKTVKAKKVERTGRNGKAY
jgi:hypothetical protein